MSTTDCNSSSGVPAPNFTAVPNLFFEDQLPLIDSLAEMKVTLAVFRQTFGYGKSEDWLTVKRLISLTGLSRPSVVDGIKRSILRGNVAREDRGGRMFFSAAVKDLNQSGKESEPSSVKYPNPTKENLTKERKAVADATPTNWFSVYADLLEKAGMEVVPEDKKIVAGNLKRLRSKHDLSDTDMYRVINQIINVRARRGFVLSPQKAWEDLTDPKFSRSKPGENEWSHYKELD